MIKFLSNIETNDGKLIYEILENNINNINDIMLDVPYADKKIKLIVENLKNNIKKELFLNILNNIKNEEEDDDKEKEKDDDEKEEDDDEKEEEDD